MIYLFPLQNNSGADHWMTIKIKKWRGAWVTTLRHGRPLISVGSEQLDKEIGVGYVV